MKPASTCRRNESRASLESLRPWLFSAAFSAGAAFEFDIRRFGEDVADFFQRLTLLARDLHALHDGDQFTLLDDAQLEVELSREIFPIGKLAVPDLDAIRGVELFQVKGLHSDAFARNTSDSADARLAKGAWRNGHLRQLPA